MRGDRIPCPSCGEPLSSTGAPCPACGELPGRTRTMTGRAGQGWDAETEAGDPTPGPTDAGWDAETEAGDPTLGPTDAGWDGDTDIADPGLASTLRTPKQGGPTRPTLGGSPHRLKARPGSFDSPGPSWRRISSPDLPGHTGHNDPLVGQTVAGRFLVEAFLGQGGMGRVYLARQTAVDRQVVLKFLHNRQASRPAVTERFHQEALAASRLHSPNTIVVHDFGRTDEGQLYMAMEYLEGRTLSDQLRRDGHFSPVRALAVALQVLASLEEAHHEGIVHRDLKPDNIMLVRRGGTADFVKVLDFGIAKMLGVGETPMVRRPDDHAANDASADRDDPLTREGELFGSPGYMAPEQVMGGEVDGRTDLYALGVILYRMLCGTLPIKGKSLLQMLENTVELTPRPPSRARPDISVPPVLDELVMRCLHKDPTQRFSSAGDMASAIRAVTAEVERFQRDQEQALLELVGIRPRVPRWWRWAALGAGLAVAVAVGIGLAGGGIHPEGETLAPGQRVFVSASSAQVPAWVSRPSADVVVDRMMGQPDRKLAAQQALALVVGRLADVPQRFNRTAEPQQWAGDLDQLGYRVGKLPEALVSKLNLSVFWVQTAVGLADGKVGVRYDVSARAPRPDRATVVELKRHVAGLRHDRYSFLVDEAVRHRKCERALELGVKIRGAIKALDAKKPVKQRLSYLLKRKLKLCEGATGSLSVPSGEKGTKK